jgi:hypothetical protein
MGITQIHQGDFVADIEPIEPMPTVTFYDVRSNDGGTGDDAKACATWMQPPSEGLSSQRGQYGIGSCHNLPGPAQLTRKRSSWTSM